MIFTGNRKRNIAIKFYVSPEENERIIKNMELVGMTNKSDFIRTLAQFGRCFRVDTYGFDKLIQEVNKIG
ncbi:MAG: plasmid mobilization protein, partial [Candidatus Ornithomonoglobus sp.]